MRWRVYGSWNQFTASEVGFANDVFNGESWWVGGDLIYNAYQNRSFFLDLVFGARLEDHEVDNQIVAVTGKERFLMAYAGLRLEEQTPWYSVTGGLFAEWKVGAVSKPDPGELSRLGRLFPDTDWGFIRWQFDGAVFLEPLLNRDAWSDPDTPTSSTLAHELAFSFRGQYAFDNRLIPQQMQVIGGLYTVRGYPQSTIAGDSVWVANIEYRYHLPRAFEVKPTPAELFGEPFRVAPANVWGRPDWDLILRGFLDAGQSFVNEKLLFEREEILVGTGVGVELQFKRNLNARLDWGVALRDSVSRNVSAGSSRVHFVVSLFF